MFMWLSQVVNIWHIFYKKNTKKKTSKKTKTNMISFIKNYDIKDLLLLIILDTYKVHIRDSIG